jgi:hypothetical protein
MIPLGGVLYVMEMMRGRKIRAFPQRYSIVAF